MARPPSADSILRNSKKQEKAIAPKVVRVGGVVLPNHSGDHSAGRVTSTPTTDYEIANKKYVDDNSGRVDGWQLIEEINVTSDSTIKDFATVLNGNNDNGYKIEGIIVANQASGSSNYQLRINGSTVSATRQTITANGGTLSTVNKTNNGGLLGAVGDNTQTLTFIAELLKATTGTEREMFVRSSGIGTTANDPTYLTGVSYITTPNGTVNITSLGIVSSSTDGIGNASVLRLYKLVKN